MPDESTPASPAPVARRTPEERLARARAVIESMDSETFYDLLLITAMADPMFLITALREGANARIVQVPTGPVSSGPVKPETVN